MSTVVVTGGAGFIGSNLVKELAKFDYKIVIIDDLSTANIGSGVKSSLNQLTQFIIRLVGNNVKPVYAASRAGDITHSLADISRARTFGYEPNYSLEEGLRQTINEYRK